MSLRLAGQQDVARLFRREMTAPTRTLKVKYTWKVKEKKNVGKTYFSNDETRPCSLMFKYQLCKHQ
jgi:hypothetical protein